MPQEQLQVQHCVVPQPIPKGPVPFPGALSHPWGPHPTQDAPSCPQGPVLFPEWPISFPSCPPKLLSLSASLTPEGAAPVLWSHCREVWGLPLHSSGSRGCRIHRMHWSGRTWKHGKSRALGTRGTSTRSGEQGLCIPWGCSAARSPAWEQPQPLVPPGDGHCVAAQWKGTSSAWGCAWRS